MQLLTLAAYGLAVAASLASAYPTKANGLHCRSGPGTNYSSKKTYKKGVDVKITCQTEGTVVFGNSIWDKTSDGCYVADHYIKTGKDGYVTKKCSSGSSGGGSSSSGSVPGPRKNDYPYSGHCSGVDKWNYYKCQCTSFVAWRINDRLGVKFHNQYKGTNWGNANTWDSAAKKTGVKINKTPVPGSIAQSNAGNYGHVAWVSKVSGSKVTIEEYNYVTKEGYGTRTVPANTFNYIHIKV